MAKRKMWKWLHTQSRDCMPMWWTIQNCFAVLLKIFCNAAGWVHKICFGQIHNLQESSSSCWKPLCPGSPDHVWEFFQTNLHQQTERAEVAGILGWWRIHQRRVWGLAQKEGNNSWITNPYSPESNSRAKRLNCSLLDRTPTMTMHYHDTCPKSLWAQSVNTVCYLRDRTSTRWEAELRTA